MSENAQPIGYAELQVGRKVQIITNDTFRGKVGTVDCIVPERDGEGDWYHIRLTGGSGSDVTPFHRHELMRVH
jgi:hypothetical protein